MKTERFSRTEKLLGEKKLEILGNARAVLFGAGAVGSYAAEGLVRSGIGALTVVDFDTVCLSNINRQLYALESTLGRQKTEVAVERLSDINPECLLTGISSFADAESIPRILSDPPDIIIDAIDSIGPKIELLAYARLNDIPIVSSMGAARRVDPAAVKIGDLFSTSKCPLARQLRKALRKRGISGGITCVFSDELPSRPEKGVIDPEISASGKSVKVLGSSPTVTGIFGLMLADTAVKMITADRTIQ